MTLEDPDIAAATAKLWELLEHFDIVMLTTPTDGVLRSRPMHLFVDRENECLWFIVRAGDGKARECAGEGSANVACAQPAAARFVSVSGSIEVVEDRDRLRALWSPAVDPWFEGGPDDADAALLKMHVDAAEFWDGSTSRLKQFWGRTKATATGQPLGIADHRRVP